MISAAECREVARQVRVLARDGFPATATDVLDAMADRLDVEADVIDESPSAAEHNALAERLADVTAERDRWLESYASAEKELRALQAAGRVEALCDVVDNFARCLREITAKGGGSTFQGLRHAPADAR